VAAGGKKKMLVQVAALPPAMATLAQLGRSTAGGGGPVYLERSGLFFRESIPLPLAFWP